MADGGESTGGDEAAEKHQPSPWAPALELFPADKEQARFVCEELKLGLA